jgi:hypothetical protein
MPNVEIHMHFGSSSRTESGYGPSDRALTVAGGVWRLVKEARGLPEKFDVKDMVVSFKDTYCIGEDGKPAPFIRICSTNPTDLKILPEVLKPLGIDIETLLVEGFFPAGGDNHLIKN